MSVNDMDDDREASTDVSPCRHYAAQVARWEPDARGRLRLAALDLFTEIGFDGTTVADIADRAGVTERTFFRHFTDKREVLFDRSADLQRALAEAVAAAPADLGPVDAAVEGFVAATAFMDEQRQFSRRRAAAIAANPGLQERELLKLSALATAVAQALGVRGVPATAATLAGETATTVFRTAVDRWAAATTGDLAEFVRATLRDLRGLTAPPGPGRAR